MLLCFVPVTPWHPISPQRTRSSKRRHERPRVWTASVSDRSDSLIPGTVPYPTSSTQWEIQEKLLGGGAALSLKPPAIRRIRGNCISYQTPQQTLHLHGNQPVSDLGHQVQGTVTPHIYSVSIDMFDIRPDAGAG